jgi:hypothetical protein
MQCFFCGEEHPAGTVFCPKTGQKIDQSRFCMTCGKALEESWKVCPKCGTAVFNSPVAPTRGGVPAKPPGINTDKRVNRGRQILLGSLVILPLLAILGITYQKSYPPLPRHLIQLPQLFPCQPYHPRWRMSNFLLRGSTIPRIGQLNYATRMNSCWWKPALGALN